MARTTSVAAPARKLRARAVELDCPACAKPIRVGPHDLVEGTTLQCSACGADAELSSEYDARLDKSHWTLVEPEADDEAVRPS